MTRTTVRTRFCTLTLACLVFAGLLAASSRAQVPAPGGAASATETPSAPAPIPLSEVIAQAESASATLKEVAANASPDPVTEAFGRSLPSLTQEIDARLAETARTIESSTSLDRLRGFETDWRSFSTWLPQWRAQLTSRARQLEADLARLDELGERWRLTGDRLTPNETPPEVRARIDGILQSAADARRAIVAEQQRVVALQDRVAEQQARADEAVRTIGARRDALVGQLLVQDSPPMWSDRLWTETGSGRSIRESLAVQASATSAFVDRNGERLVAHGAVFAVLAAGLFALRRWTRPIVAADPDLEQPATVFRLPVATALVLSILFSSAIYPQRPPFLAAVLGAIALLPTVVILRRLFVPALYPLLYAVVAFFLVDQLRTVVEAAPSVHRPLFLLEMLGGLAFFRWFDRARLARPPLPEDAAFGWIRRTVRFGSRAVLPFFAAAAVANVLGYLGLARLAGDGVLRSLYAAVVLYVLFRIADALVAFALRLPPLSLLRMAQRHADAIRGRVRLLLLILAFVLWALVALESFSLRQVAILELRSLLTAEARVGSLALSAGDVILFVLVVWLAFLSARLVRFVLEEDVFPRVSLARGVPYAVSTLVNYAILLLGFFFAVSAAGLDLTRITVLVGAFGVGIGFGLQNIFNNFISGLILLFERPIEVGDQIRIGDASGVVRRIGIRSSRVLQWDNAEVIVPNSRLISENVTNWTLSSRRRGVEVPVSVDQSVDVREITALLTRIAEAHPLVADEPAPQVLLGDIAPPPVVNYKLRVWTAEKGKATRIASDLALAIAAALGDQRRAIASEADGAAAPSGQPDDGPEGPATPVA